MLDMMDGEFPDGLDKFPKLRALQKRIHALPSIAKYIKERPDTPF